MIREGWPIELQNFAKSQTATVITIAVVAGCVPVLQPMLLGALLAEGRIGVAAMGYAATAEGLGMALGTAVAGAWLPPRRLREIGVIALLAVVAANIMTITLPPPGIVAARGLGGFGNGLLLWIFVGMLARSALPARLYGIFNTGNATLVFVLSMILASFATDRLRLLLGYGFLITVCALLLLVIRFVPRSYSNLDDNKVAIPPPLGFLALLACVLFISGVMAFWVFSVPLGTQVEIPTRSMRMIIGAATGVQIAAGLAAISLAARLTGMQVITITSAVALATLAATMMSNTVLVWAPAILVLAFCWLFSTPFHIAFLNVADPSRRAAMFVGTAQLLGLAIGPLLASTAITAKDFNPARTVSVGCLVIVLAIVAIVYRQARLR